MMYYKLPEDLLKALKDYLGTHPYAAVANAMEALDKLEPLEEVAPKLEAVERK